MLIQDKKRGVFRKVNPPIRNYERMQKMRQYFTIGAIDIYESDHAPHSRKEKEEKPYFSGFPQLPIFPLILKKFKDELGMEYEEIHERTFNNVKKIFAPKLDNVQPRTDVVPPLGRPQPGHEPCFPGRRLAAVCLDRVDGGRIPALRPLPE